MPHAVAHELLQVFITAATAHHFPGVPLDGREQAVPHLPLGREPQAVAVAAEWMAHGIDEPDRTPPIGEMKIDGRLAEVGPLARHERAEVRFEHLPNLAAGEHLRLLPLVLRIERHEFDKPQFKIMCPRNSASGTISPSVRPRIATALRRMFSKPASRAAKMPSSTRCNPARREIFWNVASDSASRLTFRRCSPAAFSAAACSPSKIPLVVTARSSIPGIAARRSTRTGKFVPHQRFAAREPQFTDSQRHPHAHEPFDLFEREQLLARSEHHVLQRHAVEATNVAAVGHAHPQARMHASQAIDERPRRRMAMVEFCKVVSMRSCRGDCIRLGHVTQGIAIPGLSSMNTCVDAPTRSSRRPSVLASKSARTA